MACATSPRPVPQGRRSSRPGWRPSGSSGSIGGPYLNEFAVRVADARVVHRRLIERGFLAGLVLADVEPDDPSLADGLLLCTTELTTSGDIARFVAAFGEVVAGRPPVGVEAGAGGGQPVGAGAAAEGDGARMPAAGGTR